MPKKAFDYGKTEIYKIIHVDPDIDLCYVGHTTNFVQRQKNHKYNCEYYGKYNDYKYANDDNVPAVGAVVKSVCVPLPLHEARTVSGAQ